MHQPKASKSGQISNDFPLYHSEIIPVYRNEPRHFHKNFDNKSSYTNEHPEFFRLNGMKEGGSYRNPYLEEVIKFDRAEEYKKIDFNRKQINLINYIKSNRTLSQDPNILKYIKSDYDIQMSQKRKGNDSGKQQNNSRYIITDVGEGEKFDKIMTKLDAVAPKISFKLNNCLDKSQKVKVTEKYNVSTEGDYKKTCNLSLDFDPQKSSYLCNCNDYKISEAHSRDKSKEFYLRKKPYKIFHLTKDRYETINSPP